MKNLSIKVVLAFVAAFFLVSCSNEDNFMSQTSLDAESTLNADEDAAYQDLFKDLNALNQKYGVDPQTRIVDGEIWLKNTFKVVSASTPAGAAAFRKTIYEVVALATGVSLKAAQSVRGIYPNIENWTGNKMSDLYLSAIGMSATDFDKTGDKFNKIIDNLYKSGDDLKTMTDAQLQSAIMRQLSLFGFLLPPNYNPNTFVLGFTYINDQIQNRSYSAYLQDLVAYKTISLNEYNLVVNFLNGLSVVSETSALRYCSDYRNTVYYSSISNDIKTKMCSLVSIGFASGHLWRLGWIIEL